MTHSSQQDYSREYLQSLTPATCKQIARSMGLKPRYHKRRVVAQILNQQVFQRVERETRQLLKANDLETIIENRWITIQTRDGRTISTSPYWGKIGYDVCKWLEGENDLRRPILEPTPTPQPTQTRQIKLQNGVIESGKIGWYVPNAAGLIQSLQNPDWELIEIRVTTGTRKVYHRGHHILTEPTYRAFAIYQSKTQRRKDGKPRRWAKRISMKTWEMFEILTPQNILPLSEKTLNLANEKVLWQKTNFTEPATLKELTMIGAGDETENYQLYF
ncbi:hypothetical protein NG798_07270 [Ancylothrix sp. C2]|uniref:hypothetical protein n=1 Tax=Ancylothrix sp. D3o TaxID=2953691 RepID=UPI0021BB45CA|nr:hypothetical protein [Ancylothrix sp. D3o]MCT7949582.1 hypothetical protein [Ancylothrix sp. D3o]